VTQGSRRAELEQQLLRDPLNAAARLEYARLLLGSHETMAALEQYDVARRLGATPVIEEFEQLRAPTTPAVAPPGREPVKLSVVPGARGGEVVSIGRPTVGKEKIRFIHIAGMDDLKKSIKTLNL
jgi:hypothetical protein